MSIDLISMGKTNYNHEYIYPYIIQVGAGGTGGYLVQHIAQLLGTSKKLSTYVVVDPDVIEEKNLGNQLFLKEEVGLKKADVLASRYSAAYGIDIVSYSDSYIESVKQLKSLFSREYLHLPASMRGRTIFIPIIIGAVDNHFTRKILHEFFEVTKPCIYIDSGNDSTLVPTDWQQRPKSDWTEAELTAFNGSGWSGQVVTGVKLERFNQAPVAGVYPEILTDEDTIAPSELSCTELSASEPQRLIVNKFAALAVTGIISQIIEEQTVSGHITFFHAKKSYMRTTEITNDEE